MATTTTPTSPTKNNPVGKPGVVAGVGGGKKHPLRPPSKKAPALSPASGFRHDLNALRAIAVLAVVLFHFRIPGFSGGFVGVDVFFVISGFLMTSIIVTGLQNHATHHTPFSLAQFYLARARRILPALIAMIGILLLLGWWVLPAIDYQQLARQGVYSLLFISNVRYQRDAGYFDAESHEKWLLHTWSLSVEWQFYLLLPVLLLLVWKIKPGRQSLILVVSAALLASLAVSVWRSQHDPAAAFFLLQSRAWQMLAGALVFLLSPWWAHRIPQARWQTACTGVGLMMIAAAIVLFDGNSRWPGVNAVLPVLGTALVIASAQQARWMQCAVVQWLGVTSYSIYLWHWPVMVALVYMEGAGQVSVIATGLALSFALGAWSYQVVEKPARALLSHASATPHTSSVVNTAATPPATALASPATALASPPTALASPATALASPPTAPAPPPTAPPTSHQRRAALLILAGALLLIIPARLIDMNNGISGRLSPAVETASAEALNYDARRSECLGNSGFEFPWCQYGGSDIKAVVIGDSHAASIFTAVLQAVEQQQPSQPSTQPPAQPPAQQPAQPPAQPSSADQLSSKPGMLASAYNGCPTILSPTSSARAINNADECKAFNEFIVQQLQSIANNIPVIMVNRSSVYLHGDSRPTSDDYLKPLVSYKNIASGSAEFISAFSDDIVASACLLAEKRHVYLLRPIPEMPVDVPKSLARQLLLGLTRDISLSRSAYDQRHQHIIAAQDAAAAQCNVTIIDTPAALCNWEICAGSVDGRPLYYDEDHLSEFGNKKLLRVMF